GIGNGWRGKYDTSDGSSARYPLRAIVRYGSPSQRAATLRIAMLDASHAFRQMAEGGTNAVAARATAATSARVRRKGTSTARAADTAADATCSGGLFRSSLRTRSPPSNRRRR